MSWVSPRKDRKTGPIIYHVYLFSILGGDLRMYKPRPDP